MDVARDLWRLYGNFKPLGLPGMTWTHFFEPLLKRFVPYNLRDQMCDEFDQLELCSMSIAKYGSYFHTLSRFSAASISTKFERIF